jgi:hypothetical protein
VRLRRLGTSFFQAFWRVVPTRATGGVAHSGIGNALVDDPQGATLGMTEDRDPRRDLLAHEASA